MPIILVINLNFGNIFSDNKLLQICMYIHIDQITINSVTMLFRSIHRPQNQKVAMETASTYVHSNLKILKRDN